MAYSTPLIAFLVVIMVVIGWASGVEPWMIGAAAVIALTMYFVERKKT